MQRKILLHLLFIVSFGNSQNTVGTLSITEDAYDAYTLFTIHTNTYLINNCGEVVNTWTSTYLPGNAVYLLPNGNLLRAGRLNGGSSTIAIGGSGGIIELFDWSGTLVWSYTYSSNNFRQHHDVYPLPNGNILVLANTVMSESEAIEAGRNPTLLEDNQLYNEQIIELEPIGTNQATIVWEWNIKDHLIQDFDNSKSNFGVISANPQLLDINFLNGRSGGKNWLHINSIQYNEERNQIILSSRHLSEIWVIDHSTTTAEAATNSGGIYGKGGDLLYRWGNPEAYDQGNTNDRMLFGQHTPYFIEPGLPNAGKIMLFNNGYQRTPTYSQVDIITAPETSLGFYDYTPNTAYGPLNTDYTYTDLFSTIPTFYSAIVSSAQQLPNGNILICEGQKGHFFEIDANNTKVWEYINPINSLTGATTEQLNTPPAGNLTFRAQKYPLDYAAFTGRDLTPGLPLETNPDLSACHNLSLSEVEQNIVNLYPNPTNGILNINSKLTINKVEVYNVLGKKVYSSTSETVDLSEQLNGIYFLKIYTDSEIISKKVLKN